jgi:hypothetical protein
LRDWRRIRVDREVKEFMVGRLALRAKEASLLLLLPFRNCLLRRSSLLAKVANENLQATFNCP